MINPPLDHNFESTGSPSSMSITLNSALLDGVAPRLAPSAGLLLAERAATLLVVLPLPDCRLPHLGFPPGGPDTALLAAPSPSSSVRVEPAHGTQCFVRVEPAHGTVLCPWNLHMAHSALSEWNLHMAQCFVSGTCTWHTEFCQSGTCTWHTAFCQWNLHMVHSVLSEWNLHMTHTTFCELNLHMAQTIFTIPGGTRYSLLWNE